MALPAFVTDPTVIVAFVGAAGAGVTGVLTYLTARGKNRIEEQDKEELRIRRHADQVAAERDALAKDQRELIDRLTKRIEDVEDIARKCEEERRGDMKLIGQLSAKVVELEGEVAELKTELEKRPPARKRAAKGRTA